MGIVIEEVVASVEPPAASRAAESAASDPPSRLAVHRELERHAERRSRLADRQRDD